MSAATTSYGIDTNWYTDTGATDYIIGELDKLTMREKYQGTDQVHTANDTGIRINQVGRSFIHAPCHDLTLINVLYVPDASNNLASVHRLTSDNHVFIEYHLDHFVIKDQATKKTLLRGNCEGGLYPLKPRSSPNKVTFGAVKSSSSRWHSRLGHPSSAVVQQVLSKNNIPFIFDSNKDTVCDACQKGKSHQLPYPRSTSTSSSPLKLVFFDVWGPAPAFVGKNSFYVSFINDFSKFTWIYLLRHKSEVFQKFQDFQSMVERQFNKKILAMQTDWEGEYQKLNSFFQRIGISHHVSCPYAHQQNGSAERKHRHIVEVGLSLLAHASMPLKFWDEAFITATYLINRLPSKVIHNTTPLERLFHHSPDYTSVRTFGFACWPNLRPYNSRKLQFRSKRCVFLGYSNLHKGFKCLDVSEGRVYISRDVVFDENIYPFSELHPNAGARLRSEILLLPSSLLNPSDLGDDDASSGPTGNDSLCTDPFIEHAGTRENSASHEYDSAANNCDFMLPRTFPNLAGDNTDPEAASPSSRFETASDLTLPEPAVSASALPPSGSSPRLPRAPSVLALAASVLSTGGHGTAGAAGGSSSAPAPGSSMLSSHELVVQGSGSSTPSAPMQPSVQPQLQKPSTRLQQGIRKPKVYTDGTIHYGQLAAIVEGPLSLQHALADKRWKHARDVEFDALQKNKTWHLVPPQKGKNVIDCKWIYKIKRKSDGKIDRYKARLVAKGFK